MSHKGFTTTKMVVPVWLRHRIFHQGLNHKSSCKDIVVKENMDLVLPLPTELLLTIVQQLSSDFDREQLKALRLTTRILRQTATPILFDTLHFSANTESLARLVKVAESPHLARNVRKLVFHRGCWAVHAEEWLNSARRSTLENLRDYLPYGTRWDLRGRGRPVLEANINRDTLVRLDQSFNNEVRGDMLFAHDWYNEVRKQIVGGLLPKLESVHYPPMNDDRQSEYHVRKTGHIQTLDINIPFTLWTILETIGRGHCLKRLDLHDVVIDCIWPYTKPQFTRSLRQRFGRLELLSLTFANRSPNTVLSVWPHVGRYSLDKAYAAFHLLLSACSPSLRHLNIQLNRRTFPWDSSQSQSILEQTFMTSSILSAFFPRLQKLSLANFVTTSDSLLTFLSDHSSTLKTLYLKNWTMPVTRSPQPLQIDRNISLTIQYSPNSFTEAFRMIPQITKLEEVKLRGRFVIMNNSRIESRSYWQATSPPTEKDHKPMLRQLESYMSHDQPFPFQIPSSQLSNPTTANLGIESLAVDKIIDMNFRLTKQFEIGLNKQGNMARRYSTNMRDEWLWTMDLHPDIVAGQDESWTFVRGL